MELSQIKEKMRVRVNTDLSKSKKKWTFGGSDVMPNMRGKTYVVEYADSTDHGVRLREPESGIWIFAPEDLSPIEETKPILPATFDPANIDF